MRGVEPLTLEQTTFSFNRFRHITMQVFSHLRAAMGPANLHY